tara:strand:+ start:115 stop:894 length:780 start_codon:yes stop_codon:yes gene_type:complete
MKIRDRIKELRRVKASELHPNPKNWRTHPKQQLDALRGILAEVGFAGAELARELPDGSLQLIDGHARAEIAGDAEIPVLILDVTESEADKILATFDPLGAMAEADAGKLEELLREVQTGSEALAEMLAELAEDNGILDSAKQDEVYTRKIEAPIYEPSSAKPAIADLVSELKVSELLSDIEKSDLQYEEKQFLRLAATRHLIFNYEKIADYYAHSSDSTKKLFEDSALVIIDFDKAIENGYTDLGKELAELYRSEYQSR